MILETGKFWNLSNPEKPLGLMSIDSDLTYDINLYNWLSDIKGSLKSATMDTHDFFSGEAVIIDTVVILRIYLEQAKWTLVDPSEKYSVTLRWVSDDASGNRKDSRSFFFKVYQR